MRIGSSSSDLSIQQQNTQTQQTQKTGSLNGLTAQKASTPTDSPVQSNLKPSLNGAVSTSNLASPTAINSASFQPIANRVEAGGIDQAVASGPTNLKVEGSTAFRTRVAQDLAKFAPGTTVDSQGFVHEATRKIAGHDQGYALVNNLLNGGQPVSIKYVKDNAYTSSDSTRSQGTPNNPNAGSSAEVFYDPKLAIELPTRQADGTIKDEKISSEVVLAHELIHAAHAQKGTINRTNVDHTFRDGNTTYKENWRFEEFRTTGFNGARQTINGTPEPTENSIRAELGFRPRATYLDRSAWQKVGTTSGIAANNTMRNEQLVGDMWNSGGAKLPNGQMRMCNCSLRIVLFAKV